MKAKFAERFNQRVQTDLFFLWDPPRTYIMLIDECIRYCVTAYLETKTAEEWMRVVLRVWIRYFGPMRCIATDQEGAITADLVAVACEKFGIDREFGGSQGHTAAPVAERRLAIVKLGALKLWNTVKRTGLQATQDDCVEEISMATNLMCSYGGATPAQALTGVQPRDLYDFENKSLSSSSGVI